VNEEQLLLAHSAMAALTVDSDDWIVLLDGQDRCTCSSAGGATLLGYSADDLRGLNFFEGVPDDDAKRVRKAIIDVRSGNAGRRVVSYGRRTRQGASVRVQTTLSRVRDSQFEGVLATTRGAEEAPIPARADLERQGQAILDQDQPLALMAVQLVDFRRVAIGIGHHAARELLVHVAERIDEGVPDTVIVASIGPQELGVLLAGDREHADLRLLAADLRSLLSEPFEVGGHAIPLSARIGLATCQESTRPFGDVLIEAESATQRGRGRETLTAQAFKSGMRRADNRRLTIMSALPGALFRGELSVRYQPIMAIAGPTVAGFEALLRWNHPTMGAVSPAEFVPIAEEMDLIAPLDRWVLGQASEQVADWATADNIFISVNLSARQLHDPDLPKQVADTLAKSGLSPSRVKLEITETALSARPDVARRVLSALRDVGVRLAMDDLGTGYTSLTQMAELPLDTVKVDRSLICRIEADRRVRVIVAGIGYMTRRLGLDAVAEGVEEAGEARLLDTMGYVYAQGYHYARPLEAAAAEAMLG